MSCKPSNQALTIEAQTLISADTYPELVSSLARALDDKNQGLYDMHRQEPEKESNPRKLLIWALDETVAMNSNLTSLAGKLPIGEADITVSNYLDQFEDAAVRRAIGGFRPLDKFMIAELKDGNFLIQKTNLILENPIEPLLVCLDETQYWREDAPQVHQAGKIFTTYLVDTSSVTNLAEITPSHELRHLYTNPLHDDEAHSVHEWIMEHDDKRDIYLHVSAVERLPESKKLFDQHHYLEADQTYEHAMEHLIEQLSANPKLDLPQSSRSLRL